MNRFKILDCTLRDGGYYTDWDFNSELVDSYISAMNVLPIDYIELGYRNNPLPEYNGKFGYCPLSVLKHVRDNSKKRLAVMLNEKSTKPGDLEKLIAPLVGVIDMIRLAVAPNNLERAAVLAERVKDYGFEVAFNVMYMSKWDQCKGMFENLSRLNGLVNIFNMVDSYGSITPKEVKAILAKLKRYLSCKIGFHGHNNLQLGLINTLTALECGVDSVDATILGMGRGAGNLSIELLLTFLNKHEGLKVDFNVLGDVIQVFMPLYEKYRWGTSLPYMISGANSIPQKEVMEWVNNRAYSFESIVRGLQNKADKLEDNAKYPVLGNYKYKNVIIIGGGLSPIEHLEGLKAFVNKLESVALIFVTARHAGRFIDLEVPKYYCLIGKEAKRLKANIKESDYKGICVLPPYPRKLGTDVPSFTQKSTFELSAIRFTDNFPDSCTTLAIQCAINMSSDNIFVIGYDGYPGSVLSEKEVALSNENKTLFSDYEKYSGKKLISLTPSLYHELDVKSIYMFL